MAQPKNGDLKVSNGKDRLRILHVDDDPSLLDVSKSILELEGDFEVDSVSSVDEALEKLVEQAYDMVVSDYEMPNKNGLDFLRTLREQKNMIPFALFTGKGREDVAMKALNLGADGYYNKQGSTETVYGELAHGLRSATEKAKAKSSLEESEKRYRTLMEQAAEAIFVHDTSGQIVDVNEQAYKSLGYTKKELLSMNIFDISPVAEQNERRNVIWSKVLAGQSVTFESTQKRKDKSTFPIEVTLSSIVFGEAPLVIALARDITERKKAEMEIQDSKQFSESIIESISEVLIVIDAKDYRIIAANGEAKKELQLETKDLIGKTCYEATHNSATPCKAPHQCPVEEALATGKTATANHVHFNKSKNKIDVEISVYPCRNREGEITRLVHLSRNVTERKKAELELAYSEEKFRVYVESSPVAVFVVNSEGKYEYVNNAACKLLGYSKKELMDMAIPQIVQEEDVNYTLETFGKLKNSGHFVGELRLRAKNKQLVYVILNATKLSNQKFIAFCENITDRKEMENALRESEKKFRLLFEEALDAIFVVEAETGILVDCNRAACNLVGREKKEIVGAHQRILHPPQEIEGEFSRTFLRHLSEKEGQVLESQVITKSGEIRSVEIKANIFKLGSKTLMQGLFRDITERKQSEEALRMAEEKFRLVFEGAADGILAANVKTRRFAFANPRICEITGYSVSELIRMGVDDIHLKKDLPYVLDQFTKQMQGKTTLANDIPVLRKDETVVYCDVNSELLRIGGQDYLVGFFRDITDRKKAEEALERTMDKLVLVNEKLGVVGGLTRHDVRNKLSVVTGYAFLLKKKHVGEADIVDGLGKMEQAVKDSMKIFDFAKMYEQLGVEELFYVDVEKALNEALALFSGLTLKVVNGCQGVTVLANSFLRHLFYNFVDNTLKYGMKTTAVKVYFKKAEQGELRLIYEDDGVGICAEDKLRLFSEGFSTGGSTGFGLFLIRRMMDVYGWTIQETGEPGKGAKFELTIPKLNKNGKENYQIKP